MLLAQQRKRKRFQNPMTVKFAILIRLFNEPEGLNANALQSSIPTSQEWARFIGLLDELCAMGKIEKISADHIRKGAVYYKITQQGKDTVIKIRRLHEDPTLQGFVVELPPETDREI